MMDNVLAHPEIKLPEYIEEALQDKSIMSYNMGIFGGTNLEFIHRYCHEAFHFLKSNNMNDSSLEHSGVWCNILFEQMFLAVLAQRNDVQVKCLTRPMRDEGYSGEEFSNFPKYEEQQIFHLLGGHKRVENNCEMLGLTLVRLYSQYLVRLLSLFPERHIRMSEWERPERIGLSVQMSLAQYEDFLDTRVREWYGIPLKVIQEMEAQTANFVYFERAEEKQKENYLLAYNAWTEVFAIPTVWHQKATSLLKQRLGCEEHYPLEYVALVPSLMKSGVREVPIVKFQLDALDVLKSHRNGMTWRDLKDALMTKFTLTSNTSKKGASRLILDEVIYLMRKGLVLTLKSN